MAPVRFDRDKILRVKLQDQKQGNIIKDLAKPSEGVQYDQFLINIYRREDFQPIHSALDQNDMYYEILIPDLQWEIERQSDVKEDTLGSHSYAKYNNWDKIGQNEGKRKAIFMDCGIHAREWVSPAFCQWLVYQDHMWRKKLSKNPNSNCTGTDLNRNFNVSWNTFPGTNTPCKSVNRGPAPESEKETKAVADFIRSHLNSIQPYLTFHSYSQMLTSKRVYIKTAT